MKLKKTILLNTEEFQQYVRDLKKIPVISHERQEQILQLLVKPEITKRDKPSTKMGRRH